MLIRNQGSAKLWYLPEDEVFLEKILHTSILPQVSVKNLRGKLLAVLDIH